MVLEFFGWNMITPGNIFYFLSIVFVRRPFKGEIRRHCGLSLIVPFSGLSGVKGMGRSSRKMTNNHHLMTSWIWSY